MYSVLSYLRGMGADGGFREVKNDLPARKRKNFPEQRKTGSQHFATFCLIDVSTMSLNVAYLFVLLGIFWLKLFRVALSPFGPERNDNGLQNACQW